MKNRLLLFCLLAAAIFGCCAAAYAKDDAVHIGRSIHIASDEQVEDAVCIFCSIYIDGKVTGDTVAIFGRIHLAGDAQHDVVNIFGRVTAEKGASIGGDLVGVFSAVRLDEGVSVGHDVTNVFGSLKTADSVSLNGDRTYLPAYIFFGPLGILVLVIFFIVREIRVIRARAYMRRFGPPPGV